MAFKKIKSFKCSNGWNESNGLNHSIYFKWFKCKLLLKHLDQDHLNIWMIAMN